MLQTSQCRNFETLPLLLVGVHRLLTNHCTDIVTCVPEIVIDAQLKGLIKYISTGKVLRFTMVKYDLSCNLINLSTMCLFT